MEDRISEGLGTAAVGATLIALSAVALAWANRTNPSVISLLLAGSGLGIGFGGWNVMVILTYAPPPLQLRLLRAVALYWGYAAIGIAVYAAAVGAGGAVALLASCAAMVASAVDWLAWIALRRRQDGGHRS
jgi:hypothetical protein